MCSISLAQKSCKTISNPTHNAHIYLMLHLDIKDSDLQQKSGLPLKLIKVQINKTYPKNGDVVKNLESALSASLSASKQGGLL